jgi:hypothetical protein
MTKKYDERVLELAEIRKHIKELQKRRDFLVAYFYKANKNLKGS